MSLIRMGEDGSDVYVYQTTAGYRCCVAKTFSSPRGMMGHLYGHRSQGDTVPEPVFEQLRAHERAEERQRGLESRYEVRRIDDPDAKHAVCRYFVLDPKHDPFARFALRAYSVACESDYPELAADLRRLADTSEEQT